MRDRETDREIERETQRGRQRGRERTLSYMTRLWAWLQMSAPSTIPIAPPRRTFVFRVSGLGFRSKDSGFRVQSFGVEIQGSGCMGSGSGLSVSGASLRSKIQCRVQIVGVVPPRRGGARARASACPRSLEATNEWLRRIDGRNRYRFE